MHFVFDFDGTLVDTLPLLEEFYKEYNEKYDVFIDIEDLRKKGLRYCIKKSKLPVWQIPQAVIDIKRYFKENMDELKSIKGIRPVLKKLAKHHELGIVSSNAKENIDRFLKKHKMDYFDFVYAGGSLFGKHRVIKKAMDKHRLQPEDIIYVGDEERDIDACRKIGIPIASVTWGYNSAKLLAEKNPDYLIQEPKELLEIAKH